MSSIEYKYLPWLRRDSATLISTPDSQGSAASAHYHTDIELKVNQKSVTVPIHIYGPGDVVGIDMEQILRYEPLANSVEFEPNYFPLIEFRDADFPWRYTPTMASGTTSLRPWLTLVALENREDLLLRQNQNSLLPVVAAPLAELPDLQESGLWAHVQLRGPFNGLENNPDALRTYIQKHPQRAFARLLCPRRLKPKTNYLIFLVPTFEVGRLAGLGKASFDPTTLKLQPAWDLNDQKPNHIVELPFYYSWSFRTGVSTSPSQQFESLARAIQPYPIAQATQLFRVDPVLSKESDETILHLEGALRPVTELPSSQPPTPEIQTALKDWINRGATVEFEGGDPQITPMLYGRWQAGARQLSTPETPQWIDELNLDPRYRIIAAVGADVVQRYQDELMHQAWQSVGQLKEANQLLRGAQMADQVGESLQQRHLSSLTPDHLLQVAGPAQQRIRYHENTLYRTVQRSQLPEEGMGGTFRRMARNRSPHLRRWRLDKSTDTILFLQSAEYESNLTEEWQWRAVDQGTISSPSDWRIIGKNEIHQTRPIHSLPIDRATVSKLGTMYLLEHPSLDTYQLADYRLEFTKISQITKHNGAIGFVFRYQDPNNYYRFSYDDDFSISNPNSRRYRRLVKCVDGQFSVLWQDDHTSASPQITLIVEGDSIQLYIKQFRNDFTEIAVNDSSLRWGTVGLYAWTLNNGLAKFTLSKFYFVQGINSADISKQAHDQGTLNQPSQWAINLDRFVWEIRQYSKIYQEPQERNDLAKLGTYLTVLPETDPAVATWKDYALSVRFYVEESDPNKENNTDVEYSTTGVMFRYQDSQNYYRFSMDAQQEYQRLVKCANGEFTLLWQRDEGFQLGSEYSHRLQLKIIVNGSRLWGEVDGEKLFDVRDQSHRFGQVALYTWGNDKAVFHRLSVSTLQNGEGALKQLNDSLNDSLNLDPLKQKAIEGISDSSAVKDRVFERIAINEIETTSSSNLMPLYVTPELNSPLCLRLIEMNQQMFLPGIDGVPTNAVSLLETNPAFIASFMVGANHEMSRECLWRGLSMDIRGTVFRQFWDVRGSQYTDADQPDTYQDIAPIHIWDSRQPLSQHVTGTDQQTQTIFLIRSELIRHFPKAQFYLVKAVQTGISNRKPSSLIQHVSLPAFRGLMSPDTVYFGFNESPAAVQGIQDGLGWYFVIEQEVSAVRFGLLAGRVVSSPLDWSDLAWSDLDDGATYAHTTALQDEYRPNETHNLIWGQNSAHMAAICQRKPFRIFIHAQQLIPQD